MARMARVVAAGVPHHVTQRGNGRRYLLETDEERMVYLDLLRQNLGQYAVSLHGYCLMGNHVHLAVTPQDTQGLAFAMKDTHGRYASYWNAVHRSSGHVWQGRFYSCPLDTAHFWETLRYTELNPVRAGMVRQAEDWPWSSASVHCGKQAPPAWLEMLPWSERWTATEWRDYLAAGVSDECAAAIRQSTHTGRPLGSKEFIRGLEETTQRRLTPLKGGRPERASASTNQAALLFE